jgi:TonB family protein
MRRALLLPFALLLIAMSDPDCSPSGRFCVTVEWPDYDDPSETAPATLYDNGRAVAKIPLPRMAAAYIFPADSGDAVVTFSGGGSEQPLVTIVARDGTIVRKLLTTDIFTANDAAATSARYAELRPEVRGNAFVFHVPTRANNRNAPTEEVRIDLADGRVERPDHDIFPAPRVWATAAAPAPFAPETPDCADGGAVRIASSELLHRATARLLPPYPPIALKARLEGTVRIDVVVSASGDVLCARVAKPLPFGADAAAMSVIGKWKFEPYLVHGKAVKVASDIEFHFARVPWDFTP